MSVSFAYPRRLGDGEGSPRTPVVVDTGVVDNRDRFLADVFSIVEPDDIRWVFISDDDVDHTGNVNALRVWR